MRLPATPEVGLPATPSPAALPNPSPTSRSAETRPTLTQPAPSQVILISATPTQATTLTPVPWGDYPAPTTTPSTPVPPPVQPIQIPPEVDVVVLLGTDNIAPYVGRTDTILVAFLSPSTGGASLVSIPRDLFVYLPGYTMQRINTAYVLGGVDLLYLTLEYNLGVRPDHWALAHLDDFSRFVDDIGGVDIYAPVAVQDPWCYVPAGDVHLDGYNALCYVRSRLGSSDFDRSSRQQDVLLALLRRFLSLDSLRHLPEWYDRYSSTIQTDLTLADLISSIPFALRLQNGGINHYQIGWTDVTGWKVPDTGAWVLLPQMERITPIIQAAVDSLNSPVPTPADLEAQIAHLTASPTPTETETPTPELIETSTETSWPSDTPDVTESDPTFQPPAETQAEPTPPIETPAGNPEDEFTGTPSPQANATPSLTP